ncbi:MAG TPA: SMP-30/gluconolactonase/LRE family protein [Steroidobacteraceae bacterium]|jgi:gluconolactonase|nr:SMP-30/gluconolactonase/LRE family protein [Steroidobacteraceae bacterium]
MADFDIIDPRFRRCVLPNAPLLKLGDGFGWLEGPAWFADHDCLIVSDIPNDRLMRWSESSGITVFRAPSGFTNGNTRDREGRLISCSHRHRCLFRTEWDGRVSVLAERYRGRRLNSPNDVVCRSDGSIWFSDPPYGIETDYEGGKQEAELPPSVYRLDPQGGIALVADDFEGPNGLAFSPDERLLYIAETGRQFDADPTRHIRVFDVHPASSEPRRQSAPQPAQLDAGRFFYKTSPGYTDGFRADQDGNLWVSAADGVHCISPDGELLGKIKTPFPVANLTFGGRNYSRLFICASHTLYAVYTNQRGAQRP